MKLVCVIYMDESDMNVFFFLVCIGEWCLLGGFEFFDWMEVDLMGKVW